MNGDINLFVGIGSPHGDDQAGWLVAEHLQLLDLPGWEIRRAQVPLDLIDWLDGARTLVVCDACVGLESPSRIHQWRWPDSKIEHCYGTTTHDLGVCSALQLAETLSILPANVSVWGIEIDARSNAAEPSTALPELVAEATRLIATSLM